MKWFKVHKKLTIVSIVFFILIVVIVASYSNGGSSSVIGREFQKIFSIVQKPLTGASSGAHAGIKGIFQFRTIMKDNEKLKEENAKLKSENIKLRLTQNELEELRQLSNVLNFAGIKDQYNLVTGNVIAMDGSNWFNIFTIDVGTDQGVYKDAVVMDGYGLIGRVMDVGKDWAKIISIIDESSSVSFKVKRSSDDEELLGILSGDGKGGLTGFMLNQDAGVSEGDVLLTTGMGMYPQGIAIGTVEKVKTNPDTLLKTLTIEPAVKFNSIQKATVILSATAEPLQ